MKIEGYGGARVAPQSVRAPAGEVVQPGGFDSLRRGLGEIDQFAAQGAAMVAEAQRKKDTADTRDALTEYERRQTARMYGDTTGVLPNQTGKLGAAGEQGTSTPGFLATRGREAPAVGSKVLEQLEADREEIGNRLGSDNAKEIFFATSAQQLESTRRHVEGHVSQEIERAQVDSIKAAQASAVRDVTLDPSNDELAGDRIANTAAAAAELATSPEDAERRANDIRAEVTIARLNQLLVDGQDDAAARVLNGNRRALGGAAAHYDERIAQGMRVTESRRIAGEIVKGSLGDYGEVNQTKVLDALDTIQDPRVRALAEPHVYRMITEREQAFAADTKRLSTSAFTLYNARGWEQFERSGLSTELNFRNPELYNRLRDDARQQAEYWKRIKRGSREDQQRQREINAFAVNQFLGLPVEQQASVDLNEYLLDRGTGSVAGSGVNPVLGQLQNAQRSARDQVSKGLGVSQDKFVAGLKASLQPFAPAPGSTQQSRQRAATWWADHVADGVNAYNLWINNNPNKQPTAEDVATIRATVTGDLPPVPGRPETISESARALSIRGGGAGAPAPPKLVTIPPNERQQIEDALRDRGRVITEEAVQALYKQVHGGR